MKPAPFGYLRPASLAAALDLLARHGDEARLLAGGQSLVAMLNLRLATPALIVDISRLPELALTAPSPGGFTTGAGVRQADALGDARIGAAAPLLALALPHVGHIQTRTRGTLGGSVAHADPSAEIPLALLVAGGSVQLSSRRSRRLLAAGEFLLGPMTTARLPDELIEALIWPAPAAGSRHAFAEFALRGGDYAVAAVAASGTVDGEGRLATLAVGVGGNGGRPCLLDSRPFLDQPAGDDLARAISDAAGRLPCRDDLHASAAYRSRLIGMLCRRVVREVMGLPGDMT
jgi:2-furoyl-CoA dehydrogenase FAD binding subunit